MADSAFLGDMLKKNRLTVDVDPAFGFGLQLGDKSTFVSPGLTKREYFAAMAMQGMIASAKVNIDHIPNLSVFYSDALIEALNK